MPEFETENRVGYYRSYTDYIVIGSDNATKNGSWNRYLSGSKVSGSLTYQTATYLTNYTYEVNNKHIRSGEVRFLKLMSAQTIQDSVPPNMIDIYLTGSWGAGKIGSDSLSSPVVGDNHLEIIFAKDRQALTASAEDGSPSGGRINNIEWLDSYPFEKKYEKTRNMFETNTDYLIGFLADNANSPAGALIYNSTTITQFRLSGAVNIVFSERMGLANTRSFFPEQAGSWNGSEFVVPLVDTYDARLPTATNSVLAAKLMFGINAGPLVTSGSAPWTDLANGQSMITFQTGASIEGWKYGLYSGLPTKFSCVFRRNHYGQPRDMLEGRMYTSTYNDPKSGGPLDTNGGINFISGAALTGESDNWLTASIYNSTEVERAYAVNPRGSGIFDKFYRVSQPFYDNDSRLGT